MTSVEVLCFIRNPFDHAASQYQQTIKTWGKTHSFDDYLSTYRFPKRLGEFLSFNSENGFSTKILNYSNHRSDVLSEVESWLAVPAGTLQAPKENQVNRSLTRSELELQRLCNFYISPEFSEAISDKLIHALPDQKSEIPAASEKAVRAFLERMHKQVALINPLLPEAERYVVEAADTVLPLVSSEFETEHFYFSTRQLMALSELFAEQQPGREKSWFGKSLDSLAKRWRQKAK
ncbi:MAG: hypothetical protein AAF098_14115 [Pseudomonadota bacterium]